MAHWSSASLHPTLWARGFEAFLELYERDMRPRLKENTWLSKEHKIRTKLLPYFGKRMISEIDTKDIIAWQNELLAYRDEKKQPYLLIVTLFEVSSSSVVLGHFV